MKNMEKYEKLRNAIHNYEVKVSELEEKLREERIRQNELDEEGLKAEILESKGWREKKAAAREHREKIKIIKAEIEDCKKAIEIIEKKNKQIKQEVKKEIQIQYRPIFQAALKTLYENLKEAEKAEKEIFRIREEIKDKLYKLQIYDIGILEPSGPFTPIISASPVDLPEYSPLNRFVKRCRLNGFKIG